MLSLKKRLSITLAFVLLLIPFTNIFAMEDMSSKSNLDLQKKEVINLINENNLEVIEIGEEIPKDAIVVSSPEEFKEMLELLENPVVETKIEENHMPLYARYSNDGLYRENRRVEYSLRGTGSSIYHEVTFMHYSKGSFYGVEEYIRGDAYLSGWVPSIALSRVGDDGYVRNGRLYAEAWGNIDLKIFFEGIGTVKTYPFTSEITIDPDLRMSADFTSDFERR